MGLLHYRADSKLHGAKKFLNVKFSLTNSVKVASEQYFFSQVYVTQI